ncbi:uncharacterized protein F5891DRAFT_1181912 [Suillus fuscotomentosus]|uniref:Stress-response A/B barrel domain-containing protein n=1 Tax=Suillus fuscotomentosus TaxID=1912939 RepID=A0AAD4EK71_9AGAM|nr:uncharacterized protein F5891DRAFT_1181912 [Suillus fuscotomentosus]KAG1906499.1 hypothetical protein F5891DRAFT_1181912 [Suillus fuscotomentosus]
MTIHHIILYRFKPEATQEQRQSVEDSARSLASQIPAIQGIVAGKTVYNPLGHGFDIGTASLIVSTTRMINKTALGVIFLFESAVKLDEYRPHKAHIDYQAFTAPYLEDKLIFDIETA